MTFGLYGAHRDSTFLVPGYTVFEAVMYEAFSKVAWAVALSYIVFACVKGYGGIVNSFLSWGLFTPLAKLVYMTYLVHLDIIYMFFYSMEYSIEGSNWIMTVYLLGLGAISFGVGFVGALSVEIPFAEVEKLVIGGMFWAVFWVN